MLETKQAALAEQAAAFSDVWFRTIDV